MANGDLFLQSVADVLGKDKLTGQIVFKAKTLLNTALKQTMQSKEVRAGKGNGLQYVYLHSKDLDLSFEDVVFNRTYIALNNGTAFSQKVTSNLVLDEQVGLTAGIGTLANTPSPNTKVFVQLKDKTNMEVTSLVTGTQIDLSSIQAQLDSTTCAMVTYYKDALSNVITIDQKSIPRAIDITLSAELFDENGIREKMFVEVPSFLPNGNIDLTMTPEGLASTKLEGKCLVSKVNCQEGVYATIKFEPVVQPSKPDYDAIVIMPSDFNLKKGKKQALTVIGVFLNSPFPNEIITSGLTFAASGTGTATVDSSGVVSMPAGATVASKNTITATYTKGALILTDTGTVTAIA